MRFIPEPVDVERPRAPPDDVAEGGQTAQIHAVRHQEEAFAPFVEANPVPGLQPERIQNASRESHLAPGIELEHHDRGLYRGLGGGSSHSCRGAPAIRRLYSPV